MLQRSYHLEYKTRAELKWSELLDSLTGLEYWRGVGNRVLKRRNLLKWCKQIFIVDAWDKFLRTKEKYCEYRKRSKHLESRILFFRKILRSNASTMSTEYRHSWAEANSWRREYLYYKKLIEQCWREQHEWRAGFIQVLHRGTLIGEYSVLFFLSIFLFANYVSFSRRDMMS